MLGKFRSGLLCVIPTLLLVTGCGDSKPNLADFTDNNIKKLRGAYGLYLVSHNLVGPKDEEEFKEFLTTDPVAKRKLMLMGVEEGKALDIFVSERDGKPFKIRYGMRGLADHPIVFESEGVDGKRFVAFTKPRELDQDEYEKAWKGELKAQPPAMPVPQ